MVPIQADIDGKFRGFDEVSVFFPIILPLFDILAIDVRISKPKPKTLIL